MDDNLTSRFTAEIRAIAAADIPEDVSAVAKLCILDWLGVTIAGADQPLVRMLAEEIIPAGTDGECTLIANTARASPVNAALINGAAGDAVDYSDNVRAMNGHATATVLPAALAGAEAGGSSGDDLLRALIVGVEAACRIGRLLGGGILSSGFHPTAVIGPFGAAAAAACLLKLDEPQWQTAFGIAATTAGGLAASVGTMCKALHAGTAAANGLLAARLARRGFTSCLSVLESPVGFLVSHRADVNRRALEDSHARFFTREILMKQHAACQLAHGSIENMLQLRRSNSFSIEDIKSIKLEIAESSARVCDIVMPRSGLEAKFSVRTLAAMALLGLPTDDLDTYDDALIRSPDLIALSSRISVDGRRDLDVEVSRASIELHDGSVLASCIDERDMDRDLDRRRARTCAKFAVMTRPRINLETATEIATLVLALEDAGALKALLRRIGGSGMTRTFACDDR